VKMRTNDYITISKSLLQRIARAAQEERGQIRSVYILPAKSAADGDDSFVFDCDKAVRDATSDG